jgi:hypothetical protein
LEDTPFSFHLCSVARDNMQLVVSAGTIITKYKCLRIIVLT